MPKYAVIQDNSISNVILADSQQDAELLTGSECREINEAFPYGIGWKFDGTNWIDPNIILEEKNA